MKKTWLYLYFPCLQLDSTYKAKDNMPIAIVEGKKSQVVQRNLAAQQAGIELNMGLGAAAALCAELQVYPYDESVEKEQITTIAQWLYLVTSDICIETDNGLLIRASSMLTLYQDLYNYWQTLEQHLKELELHYYYAFGPSPYAAKILALSGTNLCTDDKTILDKKLSTIPLNHSELSTKQCEQLTRLGVKTLGDVRSIPLADIARRFDIDLVNYIGRLTGQLHHVVDFYHPPECFHHYLELFFDVSNIDYIQKPLSKLYHRLERFLRLRDKRTHELDLTLHLRDAQAIKVSVKSAQSEYQAAKWLELSTLTFERMQLTAPITGLTLDVSHLVSNGEETLDFFAGKCGQTSANQLVSRLQAKLGVEQVRGVYVVDEHRPEKANLYDKPFTALAESALIADEGKPLALRPSFLLPSPETLTEKVHIYHGPERIVSGWWDQDYVVRDYYVAYSENGRWLWVYRTPTKQWFLHGVFS